MTALLFDGATHTYTLDGAPVPSVTTVLRDAGLLQLEAVPARVLEAALARGTAVHLALHELNENDLEAPAVADDVRPYVEAWRRYRDARGVVVRLCEHPIASRRHRVAGTLDLLCSIGRDGWLLDYATGDPATVRKDLQTAGYLGLALEWVVDDPRLADVVQRHVRWRRGAVQLRPDGTFRVTEYTNPADYGAFHRLVAAWHRRQPVVLAAEAR